MKSEPFNLPNDKIFRKRKMPKVGTKNAMFWYFWARTLKNYCHICYRRPQICLIAHIYEKNPNIFGFKMPYLGIFGLEFLKNIVVFEISTLQIV